MISIVLATVITCFPGTNCDYTIAQNGVNIPLPSCPRDFVGPLIGCGARIYKLNKN